MKNSNRPIETRDPVTGRLNEPVSLEIDRFDTRSLRRLLVPVALVGTGIGWLAWELTRRSRGQIYLQDPSRKTPSRLPTPRRETITAVAPYEPLAADESSSADEASTASNAVSAATSAAESLFDSARESIDSLGDRATDAATSARDAVGERLPDVDFAEAKGAVHETVREHPLSAGLALVAAGALASFLMPSTETEDQLLGDARDRLVERAKTERKRLGHHGKKVAYAAFLAAKDEIRRDIPLVDGLSARLREVAQRAETAATAEAEKRRVTPADLAETSDGLASEITDFGLAN